jgi:hypothetical protein
MKARRSRVSVPGDAPYRNTTAEMLARVTTAIDDRLAVALKVAACLLPEVDERRRARRKRRLRNEEPQAY